ncbi:Uncharacterised protein [Lysinibacillus sphaericus]|nr:Uncharacterised protein [Lysinibacillus sphaericus]
MNAIRALFRAVKDFWESIKAVFMNLQKVREEIEQKEQLRSSWRVCRDTRKQSQVIQNTPAFAVRKII